MIWVWTTVCGGNCLFDVRGQNGRPGWRRDSNSINLWWQPRPHSVSVTGHCFCQLTEAFMLRQHLRQFVSVSLSRREALPVRVHRLRTEVLPLWPAEETPEETHRFDPASPFAPPPLSPCHVSHLLNGVKLLCLHALVALLFLHVVLDIGKSALDLCGHAPTLWIVHG